MKKEKKKKTDTLAVIDNYNIYDRHTQIHTYGHGDSMTDTILRAESVKNRQRHSYLAGGSKWQPTVCP